MGKTGTRNGATRYIREVRVITMRNWSFCLYEPSEDAFRTMPYSKGSRRYDRSLERDLNAASKRTAQGQRIHIRIDAKQGSYQFQKGRINIGGVQIVPGPSEWQNKKKPLVVRHHSLLFYRFDSVYPLSARLKLGLYSLGR